MKLVRNCRVIEGDDYLHPILIKYEKDGQAYERLTSAEEILEMFEKAAQQKMHPTLLESRRKMVTCPHCQTVFGVELLAPQSG